MYRLPLRCQVNGPRIGVSDDSHLQCALTMQRRSWAICSIPVLL